MRSAFNAANKQRDEELARLPSEAKTEIEIKDLAYNTDRIEQAYQNSLITILLPSSGMPESKEPQEPELENEIAALLGSRITTETLAKVASSQHAHENLLRQKPLVAIIFYEAVLLSPKHIRMAAEHLNKLISHNMPQNPQHRDAIAKLFLRYYAVLIENNPSLLLTMLKLEPFPVLKLKEVAFILKRSARDFRRLSLEEQQEALKTIVSTQGNYAFMVAGLSDSVIAIHISEAIYRRKLGSLKIQQFLMTETIKNTKPEVWLSCGLNLQNRERLQEEKNHGDLLQLAVDNIQKPKAFTFWNRQLIKKRIVQNARLDAKSHMFCPENKKFLPHLMLSSCGLEHDRHFPSADLVGAEHNIKDSFDFLCCVYYLLREQNFARFEKDYRTNQTADGIFYALCAIHALFLCDATQIKEQFDLSLHSIQQRFKPFILNCIKAVYRLYSPDRNEMKRDNNPQYLRIFLICEKIEKHIEEQQKQIYSQLMIKDQRMFNLFQLNQPRLDKNTLSLVGEFLGVKARSNPLIRALADGEEWGLESKSPPPSPRKG